MIRKLLLRLQPLLKAIGKIHLPGTKKKVTGEDYVKGRAVWKNGTIFASRYNWEPSNFLISGYWKHIAVYIINPKDEAGLYDYVVEAVDPFVKKTNMIDFMRKDGLIAFEPVLTKDGAEISDELKQSIMNKAAEYAKEEVGIPYDYTLDWQGNTRSAKDIKNWKVQREFYCSELVFWSYKRACMDYEVDWDFHLRPRMGLLTVTPQDFANTAYAGKSNRLIWKDSNQQ